MKLQTTGLVVRGDSPNPMMTQRVCLELTFAQVFVLCLKVALAQLILAPLLAIAGAIAFALGSILFVWLAS